MTIQDPFFVDIAVTNTTEAVENTADSRVGSHSNFSELLDEVMASSAQAVNSELPTTDDTETSPHLMAPLRPGANLLNPIFETSMTNSESSSEEQPESTSAEYAPKLGVDPANSSYIPMHVESIYRQLGQTYNPQNRQNDNLAANRYKRKVYPIFT